MYGDKKLIFGLFKVWEVKTIVFASESNVYSIQQIAVLHLV